MWGSPYGFVQTPSCFPGNPDTSSLTGTVPLSRVVQHRHPPGTHRPGYWQDMGLLKEREWHGNGHNRDSLSQVLVLILAVKGSWLGCWSEE